jgi:transcriptional regulator of acetoin/glycerol metabolism
MHTLRILVIRDEGDTTLGSLASSLSEAGHEVRVAGPAVAADLLAPGGATFDAVLRAPVFAEIAVEPEAPAPLDDAERRHIAVTLRHTRGNKRQAAHLLGIARSTLLAKVRKYGL